MWKRNKWGETPLHVAASAGSSQIVKFIINHASCAGPRRRRARLGRGAPPLKNDVQRLAARRVGAPC